MPWVSALVAAPRAAAPRTPPPGAPSDTPAPIPPASADRATPFQLNLSWIPVARPKPWLTIEPSAAAPAPIAMPAVPSAPAPSALSPARIPPEAKLGNATVAAAPAVPGVTATAITTIKICPKTPHLFFLGGLALVGLRSPTALDGSYGRNMSALLRLAGPCSGTLRPWPAISVESALRPLASAILYHSELSPHRLAAMPCSVSPD